MPYVLSPIISLGTPGLWGEGAVYERGVIYNLASDDTKLPPVNYSAHTIKPHSVPHVDAPSHILNDGEGIEVPFREKSFSGFYGKTIVLQMEQPSFIEKGGIQHWEVSLNDLKGRLRSIVSTHPVRLLIDCPQIPRDRGRLDPQFAFTLSVEAISWLTKNGLKTFGTSFKSVDFQPGSRERPIHKVVFRERITVLECLDLSGVPSGEYFLSAFPLPLEGASESPVCPVLFKKEELIF
jgi:arylformamidase